MLGRARQWRPPLEYQPWGLTLDYDLVLLLAHANTQTCQYLVADPVGESGIDPPGCYKALANGRNGGGK